jgi:hypothetical protein
MAAAKRKPGKGSKSRPMSSVIPDGNPAPNKVDLPTPMQLKIKSAAGRPTALTPQLKESILIGIAAGYSVRRLMKDLGFNEASLFRWRTSNEEFRTQYQEALQVRTELQAEELLDMVADCDQENANATRVKAGILQWVMGKMMPKRFGDNLRDDQSVGQPMMPIVQVNFHRTDGPAANYPEMEPPKKTIDAKAEADDRLSNIKMIGEE